jgi:hypothetical protein
MLSRRETGRIRQLSANDSVLRFGLFGRLHPSIEVDGRKMEKTVPEA